MSTIEDLEQRLAALEREVAALRKPERSGTGHDWLKRISGMFENDPAFGEVIKYGREFRESQPYPEDEAA